MLNIAHQRHLDLHEERHEKRLAEAQHYRMAKSQRRDADQMIRALGQQLVRLGERLQGPEPDSFEHVALFERITQ